MEALPRPRGWWQGQQSGASKCGSAWSSEIWSSQKRLQVPGCCQEPAGSSELAASPSTETKAWLSLWGGDICFPVLKPQLHYRGSERPLNLRARPQEWLWEVDINLAVPQEGSYVA